MFDGLAIYLADILRFSSMIFTIALLVVAACGDLKNRRIPNKLTAVIAVLGIARFFVIDDLIFALLTVAAAFLVLLVTFVLFTQRLVGGGGVKLLTATVLVVGYHDLYPFFTTMAVCGAILALVVTIMRGPLPLYLGSRIGSALATTKTSVAYGVAIAAGAIVTLSLKTSSIG